MRLLKQANSVGRWSWPRIACATCVLCSATGVAVRAQTFRTLLSFNGANGSGAYTSLVQAPDGNLYGTTAAGGASDACAGGCGTVFRMTPAGVLTTLYSFCSQADCTDGESPEGGVILGTDGNLYGTTYYGGTSDLCGASGCGTVFKVSLGGSLTTLYDFCSQSDCTDGALPPTQLVQATDGNFYGTTVLGGANGLYGGYGTFFRITPTGTLTTLYSFCLQTGCPDGNFASALIQGTYGFFYGTTEGGGGHGDGTVFSITMDGQLTTLHSFCSEGGYYCTDGETPLGG